MKKAYLISALSFALFLNANAQDWKIVPGKITTTWSEQVKPTATLPEYPRPQLVRDNNWKNLNGLWNYAIRPKDQQQPASWDGKILVPFAAESALSGVGKTVGKDQELWYNTTWTIPSSMKGKKILLHFGAVDWRTTVYVNGKEAGSHEGGFDPFTIDITSFLKKGGAQDIVVRVWDPTDDGPQPRGKQVNKPEGIWYTPVTGIWQTVWAEAVNNTYIAATKQTPDIDQQTLTVAPQVENIQPGDVVTVAAFDGGNKVAESQVNGESANLKIASPKLWSPDAPFLYDLKVTVSRKGKVIDEVKSYFAMRKSSIGKDANGVQRMLLNNRFVFQFGPLDQGWWPDGLYTAPTDEALKFDIVQTKAMGFNMIRKHIKVEPARWYYYCDKLGMLVWQDMPSGDLGNGWENRPGVIDRATDKNRTPESEGYYRKEWNAIMEALHNYPSIVVWTPFNEAWGQFKTVEIAEWTMKKDPSRLVNTASGGNFYPVGQIIDLHNYPEPAMPDPAVYGDKRAIVLGEYGGLGLPINEHSWQQKDNWGYQSFKNENDLFKRYSQFTDRLEQLIKLGLSAAVYTQTTDVEVEVNGLMTYDRKVQKVAVEKLKQVASKLYNPALVTLNP
ncbi:Glycosyl hydrolases family 2, TIM barrel domain [Chitinophaga terrae (ex Kim and Jung 2007)]|uniref:Glycosyl hydrolases family 2, TIM barrel domain n=1 Tax=Chitinophaga terrae (ex Kim and Jung 2007) TaxID=408074 RepID=A0A1H3XBL5_9BACT|nr:sugar-binding domain-containing protein [Chitinophaga terrae (ex Kim and Jung 2007)]SDZ96331.1 Glycosyl hydrolases family 2, TIM barrel domain [Chitinophaga terrae (ex Kim and Jung 2007)]